MFKAYAIPLSHLWRTLYTCMDGKSWFKKMNNVFSHNTKMKPTHCCITTIYKALLHLYSCYYIIKIKLRVYMHFPWKKRKIIKMLVIKNVPLGKIFELIYLIRFIKEIHGHTFSSTFYVSPFQMILWSCITVYLLGIREVKHFKWIIMYIFKAR